MRPARLKTVEEPIAQSESPETGLRRRLGGLDLTFLGIGLIIGTGIFVLTGLVAADVAGPAACLSFAIAGAVCALAALCYAEFASTVPIAGSAYTFSSITMGERIAWIIGWDLILETGLAAAVVARGWSQYVTSLAQQAGVELPASIAGSSSIIDVPAAAIVLAATVVLVAGVRLSARVNHVMVLVKVGVVLLVIVVGAFYIDTSNYRPFVPAARVDASATVASSTLAEVVLGISPHAFGITGVFAGAAIVFFAFLGFDVVATAAEETKNPQRDLPRGIIGSLAICTVLYVAVTLVITGMVPYHTLGTAAPLADAFTQVGGGWAGTVISLGAVAGLTSVLLAVMYGQSRVMFAISRDGLLPHQLSKLHPKLGTPYRVILIVGAMAAVLAATVPLDQLADMVNIGTLFAFVVVAIAVLVLRRTRPDLPRGFKVPLMPWVPIVSIGASLWLVTNLAVTTWVRFLLWLLVGLVIYAAYGRSHSRHAVLAPQPQDSLSAGAGSQQ